MSSAGVAFIVKVLLVELVSTPKFRRYAAGFLICPLYKLVGLFLAGKNGFFLFVAPSDPFKEISKRRNGHG